MECNANCTPKRCILTPNGSKSNPTCPQNGPNRPQHGSQESPKWHRFAQDGLKRPQDGSQETPKWPQGILLAFFGRVWGYLESFLRPLGIIFGPTWGHLGASREPSWGLSGPSWGQFAILWPAWTDFGGFVECIANYKPKRCIFLPFRDFWPHVCTRSNFNSLRFVHSHQPIQTPNRKGRAKS